jgi:Na+/proline symporter
MRAVDWIVLGATLAFVLFYGLWRRRNSNNAEHYLLAGQTLPWYAMALSIMATQASAVTFIYTTGQSYVDGMRFVQFYNLWSGLLGGMFLALAYFGTDQSQVQRYLMGRSVAASRQGLMFNAVAKIPMQAFILFIGAMVFVFYIYQKPPILFEQNEMKRLESPVFRKSISELRNDMRPCLSDAALLPTVWLWRTAAPISG